MTDRPHVCAANCGQPLNRWQTDAQGHRWHPECVPAGTAMATAGSRAERERDAALRKLARVEQMLAVWEQQLPDTIRTATAVEALRTAIQEQL